MKKHKKLLTAIGAVASAVCLISLTACADKKPNPKPAPPTPPPAACAHEHVTPQVESAPTCTDDGITVYVCDSCHETVDEKIVPAKGHDYSHAETDGKCETCKARISSLGLTYTLDPTGEFYIVSDTDRSQDITDLVIPEYHDGKPVAEIASDAFNSRAYIESVSIPKTVKTINVGAFNGCKGLKSLYYNAESAEDFRGINWVFYCSSPMPQISVTIGKNVKRIPARLFYPHNADSGVIPFIKELEFENGSKLESVGDYAFYKTNLGSVVFPDSLESIGEHVFESSAIETIDLGAGVKSVGAHAFDYCVKMKSVDFSGASLETLGNSAFRNCVALETATLPDTLKTIGEKAFYGCIALKSVALGGAESIGADAFKTCAALEAVTLPVTLVTLGNSAFENCTGLKNITVQAANLTELPAGNRVFYGAGATDLTVEIAGTVKTIPSRLFYSSADVEKNLDISLLKIAGGVQRISENAFRGTKVTAFEYGGSADKYATVVIESGNGAIGTPSFGAGSV